MLGSTNGLEFLFSRLTMDPLAPILGHLSLSVRYYFSGRDCEGGTYDGLAQTGYLHLVRSGSVLIQLPGGRDFTVCGPSVLLLPRPCAHTMIPAAGGVELLCGEVDLGIVEQSPLAFSLPDAVTIPIAEMPSVGIAVDLLYQETSNTAVGSQMAVDRLLEYFMIHVLRHLLAQGQINRGALAAMSDPRLAQALNAMHERPSHPWTLERLAEIAGMSRARFAAHFHQLAGIPPLEYLTVWRLAVARGLLRQGRPLKSVAFAVGYQSPEAFGRVFSRKTGQSPAEWLRLQRKEGTE